MKKTTSLIALLILVCASSAVMAQTSVPTRVFFNLNAGFQTQTRTTNTSFEFPVYGQTATVATSQIVGRRPVFDLSVGYRLLQQIGVAVGYSKFSRTAGIAATASVPSPLFFNQPKSVDISVSDRKRTDSNVYILAVYFLPITEQFEVDAFAGPSGFRVRQDFITAATVPAGSQTATPIISGQSARAYGVNVGADANYLVTKNFGGGIFIRYNSASVDLASAPDTKAGGFQIGIGARVRY